MLPMFNMKLFASHYQTIANSIEKMNRNQLSLEDILKEEDLVNDIKNNSNSQLNAFFTNESLRKLIDYATKMPESDEFDKGYKFPYNACEILSSDSDVILDLIMKKYEDEIEKSKDLFFEENNQVNKCDDEKILLRKEENQVVLQSEHEQPNFEVKQTNNDKIEVLIDSNALPNNPEKLNEKIEQIEESMIKEQDQMKSINSEKPQLNEDNSEDDIVTYQSQKENKICYENLDYFFNFLQTAEGSSNHVLVGYFNKIFNTLIEKKGNIILPYLFNSSNETLEHLIQNLNRHMIGDCIGKILCYSNDNSISISNQKLLFLNKILQVLNNTRDEDTYEIICSTLSNCISNKQFFQLLISRDDLFPFLFKAIENNLTNSFNLQSIYGLLITICNTILKGFTSLVTQDKSIELFSEAKLNQGNLFTPSLVDEEEDKKAKIALGDTIESNHQNLLKLLESLFKALNDSNIIIFKDMDNTDEQMVIEETTYEIKQYTLGMKKLIQTEFFKSVLNLIINAYAKEYFKKEIDSVLQAMFNIKIFNTLIELFFKYQFNNMYQIFFEQILLFSLNEYSPLCLIEHLLKEEKILERMKENLLDKRKFIFTFENNINSCLFAFEINFFGEIFSSPNKYVQELLIENTDLQIFHNIYLDDLIYIFKGKLCQNDKESSTLNCQSSSRDYDNITTPKSINKCQDISLNELIELNIHIYAVYKAGGDYQMLLNEKIQKQETHRKQSENVIENLNRTNEDMVFNLRDEYNDTGEFIDDYPVITTDGYDDDKKVEEKEYFDHNYWKKGEINDKELKDLEDSLKEL